MTRIYRHTIADAPQVSRPLLAGVVPFSPAGGPAPAAAAAAAAGTAAVLNPAAGARG